MLYRYYSSTLLWNTLLEGPREPEKAEIERDTPAF
jgi:hypothetical protein